MADAEATADPAEAPAGIEDKVNSLVDRVEELEDKVEAKNERIDSLEAELEQTRRQPDVEMEPGNLESLKIGGVPVGLALTSKVGESELEAVVEELVTQETDEKLDEVRADVAEARNQYSKQAAMLQKRFTALEEECDLDTMELVTEDDHISRFIGNGPDDVFPRVYEKHKRARKMLMNARDWGNVVKDQLGHRVVFKASTVKPFLKTEFGRSFNSTEVKRIFEVVEELGEMSPRQVKLDKDQEQQHRLAVWGV